jgi:hypothetical protein
MHSLSLHVTTLVQGFLALFGVIVLFDVASPTFNVDGVPDWTGLQVVLAILVLLSASIGLGVVMHTVSRSLFRRIKDKWALDIMSSRTVRNRLVALGSEETFPGGPKYGDIIEGDKQIRVRNAAAFLHAVEYQIMTRAPHLYGRIQVYRDQYRLARAFILPLTVFAVLLPLWHPVASLDTAGSIGPFPIIRMQVFLLCALAAAVSYVAFRERSYRYAAAELLAFATLEGQRKVPAPPPSAA